MGKLQTKQLVKFKRIHPLTNEENLCQKHAESCNYETTGT